LGGDDGTADLIVRVIEVEGLDVDHPDLYGGSVGFVGSDCAVDADTDGGGTHGLEPGEDLDESA